MNPSENNNDHEKQRVRDEKSSTFRKSDFNLISNDITLAISSNDRSFLFQKHKYEFVCVGSYVVKASKVNFWNADVNKEITITKLGFRLSLPPAQRIGQQPWDRRFITFCLPRECILEMKCTLYHDSIVLFIVTGLKYASWLRKKLELDRNNAEASSMYFCPQHGKKHQKKIVFALNDVNFRTTHILETFYSNVLKKIDNQAAIHILRDIVSQSDSHSLLGYLGVKQPTKKEDLNINFGNLPTEKCHNGNEYKQMPPKDWICASNHVFFKKDRKSSQLENRKKIPFYLNEEITSQFSDVSRLQAKIFSDYTERFKTCKLTESRTELDKKVLSYVGPNGSNFDIFTFDILTLKDGEYLNDQIIDFWLVVVQMEVLSASSREKTFVFDSYFYKCFTQDSTQKSTDSRYATVRTRTQHVDIFSKDYLIIPINVNFHWILAVICCLEPSKDSPCYPQNCRPDYQDVQTGTALSEKSHCEMVENDCTRSMGKRYILILDSLNNDTQTHETICVNLREFLAAEWRSKHFNTRSQMRFDEVNFTRKICYVPKQPNFYDCGLFLLEFMEKLFTSPIQNFDAEHIDLRTWFNPFEITATKRKQVYNFIVERVKSLFPQNEPFLPKITFK